MTKETSEKIKQVENEIDKNEKENLAFEEKLVDIKRTCDQGSEEIQFWSARIQVITEYGIINSMYTTITYRKKLER